MRALGVFALCVAVLLAGYPSMAAPGGGRLSAQDLEELKDSFSLAPGEVPAKEYLLFTGETLTSEQAEELQELGIEIISAAESAIHVSGPMTAFAGLAPGEEGLDWVRDAVPPIGSIQYSEYCSSRISEAATREAVGADRLHDLGYRGAGVAVAVLDLGFTGDLGRETAAGDVHYVRLCFTEPGQAPTAIEIEVDELASGSARLHGELCARAIKNIAPDAELYLLEWGGLPEREWWLRLIAEDRLIIGGELVHIDVLSDSTESLIPLDHVDGRGSLARLADEVVLGGTFYTNALGNLASGESTGISFYGGTFTDLDADGYHDFDPEGETDIERNSLAVNLRGSWFGSGLALYLEWAGWPWNVNLHAEEEGWEWTLDDVIRVQDLDLEIYSSDASSGELELLDAKRTEQLRVQDLLDRFGYAYPVEILFAGVPFFTPGESFRIKVRNTTELYQWEGAGNQPVSFHLYLSGVNAVLDVPQHSASGSFVNVGGAKLPVGVGAVARTEQGWQVEEYSSRGPTSDGRLKPEVVAPTQYETPIEEYECFDGTSASAPIVAGVAALLVDAARAVGVNGSSQKIREAICGSAVPLCETTGGCQLSQPVVQGLLPDAPLWNYNSGLGMVNAWAAYNYLRSGAGTD